VKGFEIRIYSSSGLHDFVNFILSDELGNFRDVMRNYEFKDLDKWMQGN